MDLASESSSQFELYDSIRRVYGLYRTLNADPKLIEFQFLIRWDSLTPEEKRATYSKYACHELSFFLFKKDPEFFRLVVQPYLKNKKDKTFLDRWLVGDDLSEFTSPWNHQRLNIFEKILLGQRLPDDKTYAVRHVNDL